MGVDRYASGSCIKLIVFGWLFLLSAVTASSILDRRATCSAATHLDCGHQIGVQMRQHILRFVNTSSVVKRLEAWSATPAGNATLLEYLGAHQRAFPDYVDELRGLASGSGVRFFPTLFALNLANELLPVANTFQKGCSDFHIVRPSVQAWGHNEDGEPDPDQADTTYLVQANISKPGAPPEVFFAFTYPGQLSGWAWGFNGNGVSQSVNALWMPQNASARLGVNFVTRSILSSSSLNDALERAHVPGQAGGAHFNLGSINADCTAADPCQVSIETAPDSVTSLNLHRIPGGLYAHFNQYLHTDKPKLGDYTSSVHRLARAAQVCTWGTPPETTADVLGFLSDTSDREYPVYRSHTPSDPYITYTTSLFDIRAKSVKIYTKKPVEQGSIGRHPIVRAPDVELDLVSPMAWPRALTHH